MSTGYLALAARANRDGGFTYDPKRDLFPTAGFSTGIFKNKERQLKTRTLLPSDIAAYVETVVQELLVPGACLGGWFDDGTWYLDVSVVLPTFEAAVELCKQHDQLAFYDLSAGKTIYMKDLEA